MKYYDLKKGTSITESVSDPGKGLVFAMACACGIAVANIYYNQPMLGVITRSFTDELAPSLIPTATQFGYAIGLLLLVPLGDLMERRRLIVSQFLILALSLLFAACAFATLLAWLVITGWNSILGLVVGVMLLDFGIQSAMVANQQIIYGLRPQARNRVNSLFMVGMFIGGSLGSGGAMLAWKIASWQGVAYSAIAVALIASLISKHSAKLNF